RVITPDPAVAVTDPPQVLLSPLGVPTTKPEGRLSVKSSPVSPVKLFGLLILNVSVVVPFNGMLAAPNSFVIVGGLATVRLAEEVLPLPPSVDVIADVVFVYCPGAAPVTVTVNMQSVVALTVAPVQVILVGAVSVTVPPQTVAEAFGTVSPVGNVSVKPIP